MFESELFERFSRAHPLTPALIYLPVVAASFWRALKCQSLVGASLGLVCGYLVWTLAEYWLHRLVFHLPVIGPKTRRIAFVIHGVHHDAPWDATRLVMPAGASLGLCVLVYAVFRAILGSSWMCSPFAGFVFGYVIYDELHWYIHAARPSSRFGRWLRREHFIHHFKDPSSRFGVSCPWLDYVFSSRSARRRTPP
jgi:dihydroceramide fatty acyl 2-hydroxylase